MNEGRRKEFYCTYMKKNNKQGNSIKNKEKKKPAPTWHTATSLLPAHPLTLLFTFRLQDRPGDGRGRRRQQLRQPDLGEGGVSI